MVSTTLSIPVYVFPAARQVKEVTQEMLLISNNPPGSLATPRRTPVARRYQDRSPRYRCIRRLARGEAMGAVGTRHGRQTLNWSSELIISGIELMVLRRLARRRVRLRRNQRGAKLKA